MLNLLVLQNNQQNDYITKVYTIVNVVVPIFANPLKALHTFIEKAIRNTDDTHLKNDYNTFNLL